MLTRLVLVIQQCLNPSLTLDQFTPLAPWTRAALGCCVACPGALCNVPPDATAVPPSSWALRLHFHRQTRCIWENASPRALAQCENEVGNRRRRKAAEAGGTKRSSG